MEENRKEEKNMWKMLWHDLKQYAAPMFGVLLIFVVCDAIFGQICPLKIICGYPCPGCGLTRAFLLLCTGRVEQSFVMQPMLLPVLSIGIFYGMERYLVKNTLKNVKIYTIVVLILLIVVYLWRMCCYFHWQEPMTFSKDNLLSYVLRMVSKKAE